jgi:hypothetical protein
MGEFSPIHWLIVLLLVSTLIPIQQIIARTGRSRFWALLAFIPLGNFIGLWLLAFCRWPAVDTPPTVAPPPTLK